MNLLNHFDKLNPTVSSVNPRVKAVDYLKAKGLPTRKDEEWKYTSFKILNDENFVPAQLGPQAPSHETLKSIQAQLNSDFINIVFHNGVFNKTLSADLPKGALFKESTDLVASEFGNSFEALTAAYFTKNYILEISPDTSVEKVVNFVFYTSLEEGPALMVNPQITVKVGAGASAKVLETYFGQQDARYFVNSNADVYVGKSAKLIYVRLQNESQRAVNVGTTQYHLEEAAHLHSLSFSTGALLARHNLNLALKAHGASAVIDGLYVAKGSQHVDNTTVIDHQVGDCNTTQHYKGILADSSRGVFNGKVLIRKNAQKANSEQLNNNLLLSRQAEADSKPQLEIYADDVKAAHGSTVGQLNREELFYMESRAIPAHKAIPMLAFGYVSELVYKLESEDLQTWLNKELEKAFKGLKVDVQ